MARGHAQHISKIASVSTVASSNGNSAPGLGCMFDGARQYPEISGTRQGVTLLAGEPQPYAALVSPGKYHRPAERVRHRRRKVE